MSLHNSHETDTTWSRRIKFLLEVGRQFFKKSQFAPDAMRLRSLIKNPTENETVGTSNGQKNYEEHTETGLNSEKSCEKNNEESWKDKDIEKLTEELHLLDNQIKKYESHVPRWLSGTSTDIGWDRIVGKRNQNRKMRRKDFLSISWKSHEFSAEDLSIKMCLIIILLLFPMYAKALHSTNDTNTSIVYTYEPLSTSTCNPTNVNMKQSCQTNDDFLKLFIKHCEFNDLCNPGYEPICVDIDEGMVFICAPIGLTCAKGYHWRTWIDTIDRAVKIKVEKCPQGTFQPHESDCFHACEFKHLDIEEIPEKYLVYSVGDNISPTYVYCNYKKDYYSNEGTFLLDYDQNSKHNHYFCGNVAAYNPCVEGLIPLPNGTCVLPCLPEECRDDYDDFICKPDCREQSSEEQDAETTVHKDLGDECQKDFDTCENGECKQSYGSYVCQCHPGFRNDAETGRCADIEECLEIDEICMNGNCINTLGGYVCTCDPGYKLDKDTRQCTDIDECQENDGLCIHGNCTNEFGGYTCLCDTGYDLDNDTKMCTDIDECLEKDGLCINGNCTNTYGGYFCLCDTGFKVDNDTRQCIDIDECVERDELCNNGSCTNTFGGYTCRCATGYKLDNDARQCNDVDECQETEKLCINGNCTNTPGGYSCLCGTGFIVDNDTQQCIDKDECREENGLCINGNCTNSFGGYTCLCETGFKVDKDTQLCIDINECFELNRMCTNGNCTNTIGGYNCIRNTGFEFDSNTEQCIDIDECQENEKMCRNGNCTNVVGGYNCLCNTGYTLDSDTLQCIDIDECREEDGFCINGYCTNTLGGYSCLCETGFKVDKDTRQCIDINECLELNGFCINGNCTNAVGGYHCNCKTGFEFDSDIEQCIDIDECREINRLCANGNCKNLFGGHTCLCDNGYELDLDADTLQCIDIDECLEEKQMCEHGICINSYGGYTCLCDTGYEQDSGTHKCIDIDECRENEKMCRNGNCTNVVGGYNCLCDNGYKLDNDTEQCIGDDNTETSLAWIAALIGGSAVLFAIILILVFCKRRPCCTNNTQHGSYGTTASIFENKEFNTGVDDEDNGGESNCVDNDVSVKEPLIKDNESFSPNSLHNGNTGNYTERPEDIETGKLDDSIRRENKKTDEGRSTLEAQAIGNVAQKYIKEDEVKNCSTSIFKGGEFKKDIDDTNTQAVVSCMNDCMMSCGALIYKNKVAGTVFRVGTIFVMTAFHVIRDIIKDPTGNRQFVYSHLENSDDVTLNFNGSILEHSKRRFRLKYRFHDEELDVAVLEIMNITELEDIPKGLLLWQYDILYLQLKKISMIGFGHTGNQNEKHLETCEVIKDFQERYREALASVNRNRQEYIDDGIHPRAVDLGYANLDSPALIKFDCFMAKGLSGAPILTSEGNSPKVIGIVLGGKPDFYYQMSPDKQYQFGRRNVFEFGMKMQMIYERILSKDQILVGQLFNGT